MSAHVDRSEDVVPRCRKGDPRLRLTSEMLISVGEFAHVLQEGIRQSYLGGKKCKTILSSVGVTGVDRARDLFSRLGRRGRVPWLAPRYRKKLSYFDPQTSDVIPVAHNLLRGLVHSLLALHVGKVNGWKPQVDGEGSPLILSLEAIEAVKVGS
jgi:hypothetical protein